jgi:hypothetical protein
MKTTTTTHLISARVRWFDIPMPATIAIVIFFALCAAGLIGRLQLPSSTSAAEPTPQLPIIIIASPLLVQPPTAVPAAQVADISRANLLPRAVVAYDSPSGQVLGAIEAGRPYRVVAASAGALWLQADVTGSGLIWIRTAELYGVDISQPTPAIVVQPQVVYIASQPLQEAPQQAVPVATPVYAAEPNQPAYATVSAPQAAYPTLAPMEQTDVTQEWARQQWAAEHP